MHLSIEGYFPDGSGRARGPAGWWRIPGALPGEKVIARPLDPEAQRGRAELLDVLEASPARRPSPCPHFPRCGGCSLQHMTMEAQLAFKRDFLLNCLDRLAGLRPDLDAIFPSPIPFAYRSKVAFHVAPNERVVGLMGRGCGPLPVAESCRIHCEAIQSAVPIVNACLRSGPLQEPLPEIVTLRAGLRTGDLQVIACFAHRPQRWMSHLQTCLQDHTTSLGVTWQRAPEAVMGRGRALLHGRWTIGERVSGLRFSLGPDHFFQTNLDQAERLHRFALEHLTGPDRSGPAVDLGCGVGPFAMALADQCDEVVGVDVSRSSILMARVNACENGIRNVRFLSADFLQAASRLTQKGFKPQVSVVDPPRAGLGEEGCRALCQLSPRHVVYISCHPVSLAKDLKRLIAAGYRIHRMVLVDMVPQTHHMEISLWLIRGTHPIPSSDLNSGERQGLE